MTSIVDIDGIGPANADTLGVQGIKTTASAAQSRRHP